MVMDYAANDIQSIMHNNKRKNKKNKSSWTSTGRMARLYQIASIGPNKFS